MMPSFDPASADLQFFRYRLTLATPARTHVGWVSDKPGLLVRVRNEGYEGWGDIAPLAGYSRPGFGEVVEAVRAGVRDPSRWPDIMATIPCIDCGLHGAFLDLRRGPTDVSLPIARLIPSAPPAEIAVAVDAAVAEGYRAIKIKVGQGVVAADIELIRAITARLPPGVALRLDANRRWSLADALAFSRAVEHEAIAFIEEPVASWSDLTAYDQGQSLPFALDERLAEHTADEIPDWPRLGALVIKPSLLGGPGMCRPWRALAERRGLPLVVSAMYESGVGIRMLMHLANEWAPDLPAGLDTYAAIADDLVVPRLVVRRGRLHDQPASHIERDRLEPLA